MFSVHYSLFLFHVRKSESFLVKKYQYLLAWIVYQNVSSTWSVQKIGDFSNFASYVLPILDLFCDMLVQLFPTYVNIITHFALLVCFITALLFLAIFCWRKIICSIMCWIIKLSASTYFFGIYRIYFERKKWLCVVQFLHRILRKRGIGWLLPSNCSECSNVKHVAVNSRMTMSC